MYCLVRVILVVCLVSAAAARGVSQRRANRLGSSGGARTPQRSSQDLVAGELARPITIYFPEMHYQNLATEKDFCEDTCTDPNDTVLTKPGRCPAVRKDIRPKQCTNECTYDSECPSTKRCCSNGCARVCVEPNIRLTCADLTCKADEACVDYGTTDAKCVKTGNKNGRCPAVRPDFKPARCVDECTYDAECKGNQRCCSNGCAKVCVTPDLRLRCEDLKCKEGFACVESNVRDAQCIDTTPKPGQCPKPMNDTKPVGGCVNKCMYDSQCSEDSKCCFNGCAKVCLRPYRPTCNTIKCKVGYRCQEDRYGNPKCMPIPCKQDGEIVDIECNSCTCIAGFLLCAQEDCPPVKEGFCPKITKGYRGKCVEDCKSDYDCDGEAKCCSTGCGHTCKAPETDIVHPCKTVRFRCGSSTRCAATRGLCIPGDTCDLSPLCVSKKDPYCDNCKNGKICVLQKQKCGKGKCPRMPVCIQPYRDGTIFHEDADIEEEVIARQQSRV